MSAAEDIYYRLIAERLVFNPEMWPSATLSMKRTGPSPWAFGYIEFSRSPTITINLEGGGTVEFKTIDEMLAAGWKVD